MISHKWECAPKGDGKTSALGQPREFSTSVYAHTMKNRIVRGVDVEQRSSSGSPYGGISWHKRCEGYQPHTRCSLYFGSCPTAWDGLVSLHPPFFIQKPTL